jgi:hypothetical protein
MNQMLDFISRNARVVILFVIVLGIILVMSACGDDDDTTNARPSCNKECQRANDEYIQPDQYTDYFVNDSDGKKDLVFYVVEDIPFLKSTENPNGVLCDVLKSFDAEGVTTNVVCPTGAGVFVGSGSQSNNDEADDE